MTSPASPADAASADLEPSAAALAFDRLLDIMAQLRNPQGGCPWDLEQSFATIAPYTIEEAYEVADAIEQGDMPALKGELGDLLFQSVFYAQMAREDGYFSMVDVVESINNKMIERHPHVFGEEKIETADAQTLAWEHRKAKERARAAAASSRQASVLDGVALALPALMRAEKLQKRAARVGFDWPDTVPVLAKVREELAEVEAEVEAHAPQERLVDEIGDLLFVCANLARHLKVDPEVALRQANAKFERRFRRIEAIMAAENQDLATAGLERLEAAWQQAKREERQVD
ncbi:MAG TPA: nucleoside triphosphate pyrophosphohydrolase [Dongiaceae bacterium]|nr:nucleoside triphosphate pyrophosphohydrolase [Dongiaceae bacterium]